MNKPLFPLQHSVWDERLFERGSPVPYQLRSDEKGFRKSLLALNVPKTSHYSDKQVSEIQRKWESRKAMPKILKHVLMHINIHIVVEKPVPLHKKGQFLKTEQLFYVCFHTSCFCKVAENFMKTYKSFLKNSYD